MKDGQTTVDGNYTISNNGIASNSTFYAMACHQRYFANLAADFPAVMPANTGNTYQETNSSSPFYTPYQWDINTIYGESGSTMGQLHPQDVLYGC